MKRYTLSCSDTCSQCSGAGVKANAAWQAFYAANKSTGGTLDENAWARENGYESAAVLGKVEETCDECEGTGEVSSEVDLVDALRDLGLEVVGA